MTSLTNALQQLRGEQAKAQAQLEKLNEAILAIESLNGSVSSRRTGSQRNVTAEARRKMSLAQRARRARERKGAGTANTGTARKPKPLSIAARRRIAAAQRARWAKFRAQQKAA